MGLRKSEPGSPRPRASRWRRTHVPRPNASVVFLLLGVALLFAAGYQAWSAVRSYRATVDRVLADYAASAAWAFDQRFSSPQLAGDLPWLLEALFHPLHTCPADSPRAVMPSAARVVYDGGTPEPSGLEAHLGPVPFALRFPLAGGAGEVAGVAPPGLPLDRVRAVVRAHAQTGRILRRTEAAVGARLAGRPYLLAYSRQLGVRDTMLYTLVLDSATLAPVFRAILADRPLLPAPLTGDRSNDELLMLRIAVEEGRTLFRSSPSIAGGYAAIHEMPLGVPGLTLRVALRQEIVDHLVVGGPPASRVPLLAGLLGLAVGLVALAFGQLRREHALARLRSDFVASISHELRTPLALQRVFLDMLKLGRVRTDAQRRWSIANIDRETFRLAHLVENVLQFSRGERRQMRISPVPAELSRAIRDGVEAFSPLSDPARANVELRLEEGIVAPVDASALRQVLMNLLENAVKYGPEGQTLTIGLTLRGGAAVLTIDDQGAGIPPRERAAVFEPFRRGRAAVGTVAVGSGIGLSVAREIVRMHGGAIRIEDAPGGGARLRITLPGARRDTAAAPHACRDAAAAPIEHRDGVEGATRPCEEPKATADHGAGRTAAGPTPVRTAHG